MTQSAWCYRMVSSRGIEWSNEETSYIDKLDLTHSGLVMPYILVQHQAITWTDVELSQWIPVLANETFDL